jgi:DNA repair exonuclease SbcCD ATPase subunit
MSSPETDSKSDPNAPAGDESTPRKRPWGWIAVAGVLAAVVVGVGIYAMNTKSDLDDANAEVASQQQQIASQQAQIDEAQSAGAGAVAAAEAAFSKLSAQLGAVQQDATQTSEQAAAKLSQAEQTAADAKGTAEEVQKNAAAAKAKAEAAATCAQSFLSAFSGVFGGSTLKEGIEATVAELKNVQPQCTSALGQDGSGP